MFFWLLILHTLLSYSSLPAQIKLWLFLAGWGPALAFLLIRPGPPGTPNSRGENSKTFVWPAWLVGLVVLAALGLRLGLQVRFINWPIYDEMINGYFAMRLNQHWDWHLFFFWTQLPPLLIWLLALMFKITNSPLTAIRVLPVLISLAILPLAYHSVRRFFSSSTSFLFLALISTGYGFLYFGGICHQGLLLLFFEFLAFDALGGFLKAQSPRDRNLWLAVCGGVIGLGFYTYFSWPVVGLAMAVPVLVKILRSTPAREKPSLLFIFFLPMLCVLLPMLVAVLNKSFGSYYSFMLVFHRDSGSFLANLLTIGQTLSGLFWGYPLPVCYYGPVWGGIFNPVSGCLALLGFFWLSFALSRNQRLWFLGASALFLIPCFLSGPPISEMRIIQILPMISFAAVLGLENLLRALAMKWRLTGVLLVLIFSAGLDGLHFKKASDYLDSYFDVVKTEEYPIAYPLLEKQFQEQGPGILLFNLDMSIFHDYSLREACYPFNAADNPQWAASRPNWLSIIANIHDRPFLEREFPQGRWFWLSQDVAPVRNNYSGGKMLGLIPITDQNRSRLESWMAMNDRLDSVLREFTTAPPEPARVKAMGELDRMAPEVGPDPFLQSCYWEMVFGLHNFQNFFGKPSIENTQDSIHAIQNAIKFGYPTAYFYNEIGTFYYLQKDYKKARTAFEKAIQSPLDLTPAKENLQMLTKAESENPALKMNPVLENK